MTKSCTAGGMLAALCLFCIGTVTRADVKPHGLFADHAVLQQQMPVPVWGTADEGEAVTVEFAGQKVSTTAKDGRWKVVLEPRSAGGPFTLTIRGAKNSVTLQDILVGEVWVCAGQSNMAWGLGGSESREKIATHADLPQIRMFAMPHGPCEQPKSDVDRTWLVCTPNEAYAFSAVGYYFGRDLHKARGVPVGMIQSAVGGTFAHTWMPAKYLESHDRLKPLLKFWDQTKERYRLAVENIQKKYDEEVAKARAAGTTQPAPPKMPGDNPATDFRNMTAGNYNGSIHPLQPYAIRGALWYQGENDAGSPSRYLITLPTMVRAWRETWGQGNFAFLIVQLPALGDIKEQPAESRLAQMRQTQWQCGQTIENAGTAITIDCGNEKNTRDLHPPLKEPMGQRLALLARAKVYGEKIEYLGPVFDKMSVNGREAKLSFTHTGGGLVAKGDKLTGFAIAGEDKKLVPAQARIEGEQVVVWSDQVQQPVAVRYAWADYPVCTLYNAAGLPATPFRTDDWAALPDKW